MGVRNSKNIEEFTNDNIDFDSNLNQQLNIQEKDSILSPIKNTENNENKSININLSITEELNKSTKMETTFENQVDLIPFKFEWKEKDNNPDSELEIMLTGTFLNNWDSFVKMEKNLDTNNYEYKILLPRAKHLFKYIVNNKWKCSDLYPTEKDNSNNLNNYIDLTNYNIESTINETFENNEIKPKKAIIKKRKKIINKKTDEKYGQIFPLIKDLNSSAPRVMMHYEKSFSFDNQTNQNKLVNENFSVNRKMNFPTVHSCYKNIIIFPNEKLRHIAPNINDIFSKSNYNRYLISERKRHKYLTFVYYKPK